MREEKKNGKRDLNAAGASDRTELRYFAQRNGVSMDEAMAIAAQFGDERPTASENYKPEARQPSKRRTPQKGPSSGDAAENGPEEQFMDQWLDRSNTSSRLKHREPSAARRCVADAEKQGVTRESPEEVVVDFEQAITAELKAAKARKKK
jgi:hypothetical protein